MALLFTAAMAAGCTDEAAISGTAPAETTETEPGEVTSTCACSAGMPLVDESFVPDVTVAATAAFEKDYGDGSGVYVIWGPNIVGDWALMGLQNESGSNTNQALLHLELSGEWKVMGIGSSLAAEWQSQTPPELWPSA